MLYDIAIIGYGITGMLALAILQPQKYNICLIDPHFDGGNLMRLYGDVLSNTPLKKTINGLKLIDPNYVLPERYQIYDVEKITPLSIIAQIIKDFTDNFKKQVDTYETKVLTLKYNTTWNIQTYEETIQSKVILLCQGAEPKKLKCNIPSIPLEVALKKETLSKYVKPSDKVIVFGTAHSGTLVLENLQLLGIETTAIYKKEKPFFFDKDGEYDGIKAEAERIATSILNKEFNKIHLVNICKIDEIIKATKDASWVIYATGFETKQNILCDFNLSKYDGNSGRILNTEKAYGFGIAYPSLAPDSIHVDVGVYSFIEHIQKQIEDIKKLI
jgi:pyruvate/2-oxoglutarate dehydrogenase complex dihydrolipoamide dehydrogenase (E3) component